MIRIIPTRENIQERRTQNGSPHTITALHGHGFYPHFVRPGLKHTAIRGKTLLWHGLEAAPGLSARDAQVMCRRLWMEIFRTPSADVTLRHGGQVSC